MGEKKNKYKTHTLNKKKNKIKKMFILQICKAIQSIIKCPFVIVNEHQAMELEGVGKQIANLIKKWLQNENKYVDGDPKHDRRIAKEEILKFKNQSFCFSQQNDENNGKRKAEDNIHLENMERQSKKQKKNSKSQKNENDISHSNPNVAPYIPKKDSAGFNLPFSDVFFFFNLRFCAHTFLAVLSKNSWAILIVMGLNYDNDGTKQLTKQQIMAEAQEYTSVSFTAPVP